MRKKFVLIVLVPFLVLAAILYVFLDSWVESGLELAGESLVGAKVEIDNLTLSLMPVGMKFTRLQVADPKDPWTNAFETGPAAFAMDFGQLLRGKFIIETIEVNELILGTKRTTDGSLPRKPDPVQPAAESDAPQPGFAKQAETIAAERTKDVPVFDLAKLRAQLNIDSLLDVRNLRSARHIDSLKQQVQQASQQWQATLADIDQSRERAKQIEGRIRAININELKTLDKIVEAVKNADEARKSITEISQSFNNRKQSLTTEVNRIGGSVRSIDDFVRQDYNRLVQAARLPDVTMQGLAELLLGNDILRKANEYLYWVDLAREKVRNSSPTPDNINPPRLKGQTILFPSERGYPKFWIKKILVSGGTDRERDPNYFYATGEVLNITSNQKVTGVPMTIDLGAQQGRGTAATLSASFDRTKDLPVDAYKASLTGVPVAAMEVGRSDFVPSRISDAMAGFSVQATVPGNQFDADARIAFTSLRMEFDRGPRNTVERLVRGVLESIKAFNVRLRLWKKEGKFDVAFETDLDNLLAERTRRVIGDEVARLRNELRAKLDQKIREKRAEVERLISQKREEVANRLRTYENQIKEHVAFVEKKKEELEKKIADEKKKQEDELKKKAGDVLKGILKK